MIGRIDRPFGKPMAADECNLQAFRPRFRVKLRVDAFDGFNTDVDTMLDQAPLPGV